MGSATIDVSASGIDLQAAESLSSLGADLISLIQETTFSDFDDDDMGSTAALVRRSASAPSAVEYDIWGDSTLSILRIYSGPSGGNRWAPADGTGDVLTNSSGGNRAATDAVAFSSSVGDGAFDADPSDPNTFYGVCREAITDAAAGMVQMGGYVAAVKVDGVAGAIAIGDFLGVSGGSGANMLVVKPDINESCAIALEASSSQNTIKAIIWPHNA